MPRMISFARTADLFREGSKTVTRRDGWKTLEPGTILEAVDRLPRVGPYESLGLLEVLDVRTERLGDVTQDEVALEGYPGRSPEWFVSFYCAPGAPDPDRLVQRIAFRRLD